MNVNISPLITHFNNKDSGFSVKSVYDFLRGPVEGNSVFVSLWKTTVLPSAQVTAWRVLINLIAT